MFAFSHVYNAEINIPSGEACLFLFNGIKFVAP